MLFKKNSYIKNLFPFFSSVIVIVTVRNKKKENKMYNKLYIITTLTVDKLQYIFFIN